MRTLYDQDVYRVYLLLVAGCWSSSSQSPAKPDPARQGVFAISPAAFSWTLVEGEMVRAIDGTYRFDADDDGTRVSYDLAIDPSIPLPGFLKRRTAGMIVSTALKELKKEVESA